MEKFIRCNGAAGVIKAANAVARRRAQSGDVVRDPWAYCIRVYNGNVARSAALHPLLYVLENALRSRVTAVMTAELGPAWYRDPHAYLDSESAGRLLKGDDYSQVQERKPGAEAPYPVIKFRSGITFVERIPFAGLQRIIEHNYGSGCLRNLFTSGAGEDRLDPEHVTSSLGKLSTVRNDVAHHRAIGPESFLLANRRTLELLAHLEFDTSRAFDRIYSAIKEERDLVEAAMAVSS